MGICTRMAVGCPPRSEVATGVSASVVLCCGRGRSGRNLRRPGLFGVARRSRNEQECRKNEVPHR